MNQKLLSCLLLCFVLLGAAHAQERRISGKVTSAADGEPLPGVSVIVTGTVAGTTTDGNGNFALDVPRDARSITFRYLGHQEATVSIGVNNIINVVLEPDASELSEVLIVGYSTSTQQAFTGSAKQITNANLDRKNVSNLTQALAGEAAGLRIINDSGQPGATPTVRIRGFGSVNGNRDPLYVLDGVPYSGNINAINMADVESTTILKDAAATAIYGSRGANGVILITTKSGKGQAPFIEVDGRLGTNRSLIPRYDVITSPEDYIGLAWEALYNQGSILEAADPVAYANARLFHANLGINSRYNLWNAADAAALIDPVTRRVREGITRKFTPENWQEHGMRDAARGEVNLKLGGSGEKSNYFSSLGYIKDRGYVVNTDFERISGRLNLTQEVKSWLNASMNIGYAKTKTNKGGQTEDSGSVFLFLDNMPPIYPVYLRDGDGNYVPEPVFGGNQYDYGSGRRFSSLANPLADIIYNTRRDDRHELNGSASLNFKLLDGLTLENTLGLQYYNNTYIDRRNKFYGQRAAINGRLSIYKSEFSNTNLLNLLRYKKDFGTHNLEFLAAHEATDYQEKYVLGFKDNLIIHDTEDFNQVLVSNPITGYTEAYSLESYFLQGNYDYAGKYYLSGSIRRDGSSRFVHNKWGTFGSLGAAWVISNESFMADQTLFSNLKLKASYGLIGEQAGIGFYPGYDLYTIENLSDQPAFSIDEKGNPDLTWETSRMFQTGVEFKLGSYLSGAIDYYIKNTTDLIFDRRVGPSIGYALLRVNDGQLRNQGLEFDLTGHILKSNDYHFDISVNGEMFRNRITTMPLDPVSGQPKIIDVQGNYGWAKGRSIYDFYIPEFAGVDTEDGASTWYTYYVDLDGDGQAQEGTIEAGEGEHIASLVPYLDANPEMADRVVRTTTRNYSDASLQYIGKNAIPKLRGAFNLSGGYKGFDVGVQFLYSIGGYALDRAYATLMDNGTIGANNWHKDMMNRWTPENPHTDVPRLSSNTDLNVSSSSSRFVTKAGYMALNNIRVSYEVPSSLLARAGAASCSIWLSGDNLWLASARRGFNPSTHEAGSSDVYRYAPLSTFSAGLRVKW